jgi:hypothetical protein
MTPLPLTDPVAWYTLPPAKRLEARWHYLCTGRRWQSQRVLKTRGEREE